MDCQLILPPGPALEGAMKLAFRHSLYCSLYYIVNISVNIVLGAYPVHAPTRGQCKYTTILHRRGSGGINEDFHFVPSLGVNGLIHVNLFY